MEEPYLIISVIKKISQKNKINDKDYLQIGVLKKDLIAYLKLRYNKIGFCKKIV